jgi:DHA1 family tetracycline resistance protein-like MFS transporter
MSQIKPSSEPGESAPASGQRSAMMIVFFVVVVDLLGFGIVLPLLPVTGEEYLMPLFPGAEGSNGSLMRGLMIGLLLSSFSAMQFLFAPSWGRLSDRVGRRPVLLVGLVGSVLFYSLFGYAAGLPATTALLALILMFVARIGAGVAGATISTAQAVIADSTPPEKRKHGMALIGAAFGIAFVVGPILGALAMRFADDPRVATSWTGYIAAGLSLLALVLAVVKLPETLPRALGKPAAQAEAPVAPPRRRMIDLDAWKLVLTTAGLAPVVLTFFLATLGFGAMESTLARIIKDVLIIDKKNAYWLFAYVGFVLMLTQGFLYRKLARKLSEATFMLIGIALMALGVVALGGVCYSKVAGDADFNMLLTSIMLALAVAVVGFAFLTPSAQALVSRRAPADRQGEILGVNQSAAALARIIGPIFGNGLYSATSTHLLPYLFGAGLLLLMLPLMPRVRRG